MAAITDLGHYGKEGATTTRVFSVSGLTAPESSPVISAEAWSVLARGTILDLARLPKPFRMTHAEMMATANRMRQERRQRQSTYR